MTPYDIGYQTVLEKIAAPLNSGWWASRGAPGLKNFGKGFLRNLIGDPKGAYRQARAGTLFSKGGLGAEGFAAPKMWQKGLLYGLPAVSAVQTLRSDDPNKGEAIAGLGASILAGNAAFGPLGILGSMPIAMGADYAARRFVRGSKNLLGVGAPQVAPYTSNVSNLEESRGTFNPAQQWSR